MDHRVKMKVSEKTNKYLDLARELINLENIKITVILITLEVLGNGHKMPEKENGGMRDQKNRVSTDHSIIKSARILRGV